MMPRPIFVKVVILYNNSHTQINLKTNLMQRKCYRVLSGVYIITFSGFESDLDFSQLRSDENFIIWIFFKS